MDAVDSSHIERRAAAARKIDPGNSWSVNSREAAERSINRGHHALMTIDAFKTIGGYAKALSQDKDDRARRPAESADGRWNNVSRITQT